MEKRSIRISFALVVLFALALLGADAAIWSISGAFMKSMPFFTDLDRYMLIACLYMCNVPGFMLLHAMGRLLRNLEKNQVFQWENVRLLRTVSRCCFGACLVCLLGSFFVYSLFLIAAAAFFMGLVVRIVKNVFEAAIPMRDELDFTV